MRSAIVRSFLCGVALVALATLAACSRKRKLCRVNDQCFVCHDDKSLAKCIRDPASARCKWTPPTDCR